MTMLAVAPLACERSDREETLAAAVGAAWEELSAGRAACCPVCHGRMEPEHGGPAKAPGGLCSECGARLT